MTKNNLCQLFQCPNDKDGFQMAMHRLGKRLRERNWRVNGFKLTLMGFSITKNKVSFCTDACQTFSVTVDEAIDCISGNLNNLLKFKP